MISLNLLTDGDLAWAASYHVTAWKYFGVSSNAWWVCILESSYLLQDAFIIVYNVDVIEL